MNYYKNNPQKYIVILAIFISLFFVDKLSYAQNWAQTQDQIKKNTQRIEIIDEKISDLKDNYRLLYDGAKNQNDQLSNQISFAGCLLGVFSFIFTILGIFLAFYINLQFEKVKKMKDIVETTKAAIDGHSTDLYKKLKREETLSLLIRLEEVPEDIINIADLLLSRELIESDFLYLKTSYLNIKMSDSVDRVNAEDLYLILLMQHFPYESLKDLEIEGEFIKNIDIKHLDNMFSRDVRKFFDQVLKYLKEFGVDNEKNKTTIKNLFYNYSKSKFRENIELQNHIKETLSKYGMKTPAIASILKEQNPKDNIYIAWVDLIFT